jgi:hypothetical protein
LRGDAVAVLSGQGPSRTQDRIPETGTARIEYVLVRRKERFRLVLAGHGGRPLDFLLDAFVGADPVAERVMRF